MATRGTIENDFEFVSVRMEMRIRDLEETVQLLLREVRLLREQGPVNPQSLPLPSWEPRQGSQDPAAGSGMREDSEGAEMILSKTDNRRQQQCCTRSGPSATATWFPVLPLRRPTSFPHLSGAGLAPYIRVQKLAVMRGLCPKCAGAHGPVSV